MKITLITLALAGAFTLSACGAGAADGSETQVGLAREAVKAMEAGDYDTLVELCSPSTRLEAASGILMAKAFDPKGTLIKAAAAELKADIADGRVSPSEMDRPPVLVDGRWFLDCKEEK